MRAMKRAANALQLRAVVSCFIGLLLMGCNVKDKWIEQMILEMESAWIEAEKAGRGQEGRDAAVLVVVQKYFRPGMLKEEAFVLLRQLKEDGFDVGEYRHEGARNWPDGELKPYLDEEIRKSHQNWLPKGLGRFVAEKQYGRVRLFATKHAAIGFRALDSSSVITEVEGTISASGI